MTPGLPKGIESREGAHVQRGKRALIRSKKSPIKEQKEGYLPTGIE